MDWERRSLQWSDHHFDYFNYDKCETRETTVLSKLKTGRWQLREDHLITSSDWNQWFETASFLDPQERRPGICILLCSRGKDVFEGTPAPLYDLPFPKHIFSRINEHFFTHPTISRTIDRMIPYFSFQRHKSSELGEDMITSTARTSGSHLDDLAISATYLVNPGLTLAVVYGCNESQKKKIKQRMDGLELTDNHPMLVPGILAELERVKLSNMVGKQLEQFTLRAYADSEGGLGLNITKVKLTSFLELCWESRDLINQIRATSTQITKTAAEIPKLSGLLSRNYEKQNDVDLAGEQIRIRLDEIDCELQDKIQECQLIIDNMSLTMQTAWNHFAREDNQLSLRLARTNTGLSQDMSRDSSQMRSIALLTMVFLPLTTLASVFSSNLFSWDSSDGSIVFSRYIWVFVVIAVGLTTITVGAWHLATRRQGGKQTAWSQGDSLELGLRSNH